MPLVMFLLYSPIGIGFFVTTFRSIMASGYSVNLAFLGGAAVFIGIAAPFALTYWLAFPPAKPKAEV